MFNFIKELFFNLNTVVDIYNKFMKEERGRKKYTEKQPPDKTYKKNKPKYVAKESV